MCVVSMIGDHYRDKWTDPWRWQYPVIQPPVVIPQPVIIPTPVQPPKKLSPEEAVKRAIEVTRRAEQAKRELETLRKERQLPTSTDEYVTIEQFEQLKREVEEMHKLLKRAKQYDTDNNEPDCEIDEKVDLLKQIAAAVGVSLEDVFGKKDE